MSKIQIITYIFFVALGIVGCIMGGFAGGVITGVSLLCTVLSLIGKMLVSKAMRRITKGINDKLSDQT